MAVSSVHSPFLSLNLPPSTISEIGLNLPRLQNSIGAPSASPTASPTKQPIKRFLFIMGFLTSGVQGVPCTPANY
ncbi:hypothetical protein THIOM_004447 [Candidatus Thiomargarita nelsonii]|uniref:Uncharacterized protein n=1 Tax=Candidatus Thiomargarita nelsonii TaxID=1003181 RepID=A0A176RVV7_9GAMM|nr:hypothetical protein THIOM_004447 [Candidatus Thiomargarita nelsonii]